MRRTAIGRGVDPRAHSSPDDVVTPMRRRDVRCSMLRVFKDGLSVSRTRWGVFGGGVLSSPGMGGGNEGRGCERHSDVVSEA